MSGLSQLNDIFLTEDIGDVIAFLLLLQKAGFDRVAFGNAIVLNSSKAVVLRLHISEIFLS